MLKEPSKFLATIQIGITLAGFLSSAFAADAFASELAPKVKQLNRFRHINLEYDINNIDNTYIIILFISVWGISTKKNGNEKSRKNCIWEHWNR